jgi:hypothetical protein
MRCFFEEKIDIFVEKRLKITTFGHDFGDVYETFF